MRVLGIDPSSSKCGWALVVNGVPEQCRVVKPPSKLKTQFLKLAWWGDTVEGIILFTQPDLIVIEEVGRPPKGNVKILRTLVRFEAVCTYHGVRHGYDTILVAVTAAREVCFGSAKTGKETAYETLRQQYPQFEWPAFDKGGNDMSDALAMGIAGPELRTRI